MAPTHSGATAPVRAQGPARYSVYWSTYSGLVGVRLGLRLRAPSHGSGVPHARPELDAMTRSGSVAGLGSFCSGSWRCGEGGQAVIF